MSATATLLLIASFLPTDSPAARVPYPDQSDPRSAAFSLTAAIAKGDTKTAKAIYAGKDKKFLDLIDAMGELGAAAEKYNKAVSDKYGPDYAGLLGFAPGELGLKLNKERVTTLMAVGVLEQDGDEATLALTLIDAIRLKKDGGMWKVTEWPADLSDEALGPLFRRIASLVLKQAEEVEKGKYPKPHEAVRAFRLAVAEMEAAEKKDDKK